MASELFYTRRGTGPLVVLLHPVGLDGTFWGDLPETLAATHTVLTVDTRGHGQSPEASRPGHLDTHIDDFATLLAELDLGPATLVGVSFGGMIAQNLAARRPDLVSALVLCACPGAIPVSARDAIVKRGTDAEAGGMAAVVPATLERWFTPEFMLAPEVEAVRQRLLSNTPSNWAATWEAVAEHDALDALGSFRGPTLVVVGDKDAATSIDAARSLAEAAHDGRLEVIVGAPHILQLESAAAFTQVVTGFLGSQVRR